MPSPDDVPMVINGRSDLVELMARAHCKALGEYCEQMLICDQEPVCKCSYWPQSIVIIEAVLSTMEAAGCIVSIGRIGRFGHATTEHMPLTPGSPMTALDDIAEERRRQVDRECPICGDTGWEAYGIGHMDPHFRECESCGNPEGKRSP